MGAVAEGSPSIRAQANLSALGLHEWIGYTRLDNLKRGARDGRET